MRKQRRLEKSSRMRPGLRAVLGCLLGAASAARGQSVIAPPPSFSLTPPAVEADMETHEGYLSGSQIGSVFSNPESLFHWGPVQGHPHFSYGVTYGTGIQSTPGVANASAVQTFSPGISFLIGTRWSLDYTPTFTYYSSSNLRDTLGQSAALAGSFSHDVWQIGVSQNYNYTDSPNVQTGTQVAVESYGTSLTAAYAFNSEYSLDSTFTQSINESTGYNSTKSWGLSEYLNYQFFPRLTVGLGLTLGYDSVSVGDDDLNEALQLRLNWRTFQWLSVSIHGGGENTEYLGTGSSQSLTPVFGADIGLTLGPHTSLSLAASRSISPSLLGNQSSTVSAVSLGLTQRLLGAVSFNSSVGYNLNEYGATVSTVSVNRTDTTYNFNAALNYAFLRAGTISGTYSYSKDTSSSGGFGYSSSQVGINVGYHF